MTHPPLETLKARNLVITKTIDTTQATLDALTPERKLALADKIDKAMAQIEVLKKEFSENEEKIFEIEFSGVQAKRSPGRPKSVKTLEALEIFELPGSKTSNREAYIASLESAIQKDMKAIQDAEMKLVEFRLRLEAKMEKNRELIEQTRAKLGSSFTPEDL